MAAASWNRGSGADTMPAAERDVVYANSLRALEELADAVPRFAERLQTKEQLDAQQRILVQNGGSVEQTGTAGDHVRLRVSERVGRGTFCVVFRGELQPDTPGEGTGLPVAAKFELRKNDSTQLRNEFRMYKKFNDCHGIAKVYSFGEMDFHKVLVMDLLGPSLENLFQDCGRQFSIKTVCMLAKQMITRIQLVHERGLIYRDIKPENFLMGLPTSEGADTVYLIDYGMAKVYRDPDTNQHIPYGEAQSLSGTARYMSINAHCRHSQSRRDDLEALGHVFMYFARGSLPWQSTKMPHNEGRYDRMCEKKQATTIDDLCRGFPAELAQYMSYTRSLTFDGDPDYDYLRGLFNKILDDQELVDDHVYDWANPGHKKDSSPHADPSKTTPLPPQASPIADAALNVPTAVPKAVDDLQKTEEKDDKQRPTTPPHATPNHHGFEAAPPASPPGAKRRRSEFASDLRPPTRARSKKTAYAFYDSQAQQALVTLYRDIMAKRYAFFRMIKQSRAGMSTRATANAAASLALAARGMTMSGGYKRQGIPAHFLRMSVISEAFTESLDKTLSLVISELEEMSDKLLQDGDWSGAARVHAWLKEVSASIQDEMERIRNAQEDEKTHQQEAAEATQAASTDKQPPTRASTDARDLSLPAMDPPILPSCPPCATEPAPIEAADDPNPDQTVLASQDQTASSGSVSMRPRTTIGLADALEVDDGKGNSSDAEDLGQRAQYHLQPSRASPSADLAEPTQRPRAPPVEASALTAAMSDSYVRTSPSAAVQSGMGHLSLAVQYSTPLEVDDVISADGNAQIDADDEDTENEILELVYRTASGSRKVVRVAQGKK